MNISLVGVDEVADRCRLHRLEMLRFGASGGTARVGLAARVTSDADRSLLKLRLAASYSWERGMLRRRLLDYEVDAVFEVDDFERHFGRGPRSPEVVDMPPSVLRLMLTVAVGALRGMIALRTAGTPLGSRPLPLVNVSELLGRLIYGSEAARSQSVYPLTAMVVA